MELLGEDFGDLRGLSTPEDTGQEKFMEVLCEGCGPTYVDHDGVCRSPDCTRRHGAKVVL